MRLSFFPKSQITTAKETINKTVHSLVKSYTSQTTQLIDDSKSKTKDYWGYTQQEHGFGKHDKNTTGLYHLGTINLPKELEKNINEYLRKFPRKHLVEDAVQLSKHLENRGRPTERTWAKYKEAKAARKLLDSSPSNDESEVGDENQAQKPLTKKPKKQEYKIIRYQKREAAAYIADRVPSSYGATLRVLHEIAKRNQDFKPETVLDYGSGIGTAIWAAHKLWKDSVKIYQCVDVSRDMNETAEQLIRNSAGYRTPHYIPRVYFKEYLPVTDKVTYDVVLASYSLSEIPFSNTRQQILKNLWRKTNYFLVIVEKGNNEGFDIITQARDLITEKNNEEAVNDHSSSAFHDDDNENSSGFIFSPCPHDLECPRSDVNTRDHPCNFEQRVQLSFAQRNSSLKQYGYYNEVFSYVVLRKGKRSSEELDWPRLVRPVRLREKHVICDFCSKNGSLGQKILTKRKNSEVYKCVRHRAKWGDLVPIDEKKDEIEEITDSI